tara:strand:- start:1878 stop:2492 length:615 start_codon:yes stop_codon:yes gene_type:complete
MGKRQQRENEELITSTTTNQTQEMKEWQAKQTEVLAQQKQQYKEFEFTNPFEDLTVNQESARFQMEQGAQQRANIMAGLQGAAGSSGIAGLAQSLAGQGAMQARQVSADIGQQEAQNAQLAAQGSAAVQQAEFGRESTLYAAELGEMAGARGGVQAAFGNEMAGLGSISQMNAARTGMWGDIIGGVAQGVGSFASGGLSTLLER